MRNGIETPSLCLVYYDNYICKRKKSEENAL